ncbi:mite group 2 allergen-like Ixo r 2 [Haemaphysalis longicornis]
MLRYLAAFLLLGLALGQRHDLKYQDCGSTAKIKMVQIEPCNSDPCVFQRGNKTTIHFTIVADQDSKTATISVKVKALMFWINVPGVKPDLCSYMVKCPIKKGQEYSGSFTMSVPRLPIPMKSTVQVELKLDHGVSVCAWTKVKFS